MLFFVVVAPVIVDVIILYAPSLFVAWLSFDGVNPERKCQRNRNGKINCNTLYYFLLLLWLLLLLLCVVCHNVYMTLTKLIACINTFTMMVVYSNSDMLPPPLLSSSPPITTTTSPQQLFPFICLPLCLYSTINLIQLSTTTHITNQKPFHICHKWHVLPQ